MKAFPENYRALACNRLTPGVSWPVIGKAPDVWSQNAAAEEQLCSGPRVYFGRPRTIDVLFADPRKTSLPAMRVVVQTYAHSSEDAANASNPSMVDFTRDEVPTYKKLQRWAEAQFERERTTSFQDAVQTFLYAYATEGHGLPKHSLVSKVHQMGCFFRIWRTPFFYCRDPKNKLAPLPLSAQARLRSIARSALHGIEHDVLKKLDDCLTQTGAPKDDDRMAIWACMWQLMLMYRDLANANKSFAHYGASYGADAQTIREAVEFDRRMMKSFYPLLTMFYHYQFRMKKSVELSLDWISRYHSDARKSKLLHQSAKDMDAARRPFYKSLENADNEVDQYLEVFVVAHEIRKLNARKRPSKATPRSSSSGSGSSGSRSSRG